MLIPDKFMESQGVNEDFIKDTPNVVTEVQLRACIAQGHRVEVVAVVDPVLKKSFWTGEWIIRVISEDGLQERVLVPMRSVAKESESLHEIQLRTFKTVNGVVAFMYGIGCKQVTVPLERGGRALHEIPKDSAE